MPDKARVIDWDEHLRVLSKYRCPCGSGGPFACDDDCSGDTRDDSIVEALRDIIFHIKTTEQSNG